MSRADGVWLCWLGGAALFSPLVGAGGERHFALRLGRHHSRTKAEQDGFAASLCCALTSPRRGRLFLHGKFAAIGAACDGAARFSGSEKSAAMREGER